MIAKNIEDAKGFLERISNSLNHEMAQASRSYALGLRGLRGLGFRGLGFRVERFEGFTISIGLTVQGLGRLEF